jgi:hypothetical protein
VVPEQPSGRSPSGQGVARSDSCRQHVAQDVDLERAPLARGRRTGLGTRLAGRGRGGRGRGGVDSVERAGDQQDLGNVGRGDFTSGLRSLAAKDRVHAGRICKLRCGMTPKRSTA